MEDIQAIKVLVVEDDKEDYLLAKHYLSNIQTTRYIVEGESDYSNALFRIAQMEHDVYIIDYNLGGNNGIELVRQAVNSGIVRPFIFLTGMDSREIDMEAMDVGATDYLIKNKITAEILERSIRYAIKQKETEIALIQANATKDKLFSVISHDLRSPIGAISKMLELLSDGDENDIDEKLNKKLLKELHITSEQTYDLLDNLLHWSRSQLGAISIQPTEILFEEFILGTIELFDGPLKEKHITVQKKFNGIEQIFTDKYSLQLVMRNIFSNAVKFTKEGGNIEIGAQQLKNKYKFYVKDSGVGMDSELSARILKKDSFYTSAGTNKEKGSGLGIKICMEYIEKLGGKLKVDSTPNEGSTFYFTIPIASE